VNVIVLPPGVTGEMLGIVPRTCGQWYTCSILYCQGRCARLASDEHWPGEHRCAEHSVRPA
jgi:hypothetical protein